MRQVLSGSSICCLRVPFMYRNLLDGSFLQLITDHFIILRHCCRPAWSPLQCFQPLLAQAAVVPKLLMPARLACWRLQACLCLVLCHRFLTTWHVWSANSISFPWSWKLRCITHFKTETNIFIQALNKQRENPHRYRSHELTPQQPLTSRTWSWYPSGVMHWNKLQVEAWGFHLKARG